MTDSERLDFIQKYEIEITCVDRAMARDQAVAEGWMIYGDDLTRQTVPVRAWMAFAGFGMELGATPRMAIDAMAARIAWEAKP